MHIHTHICITIFSNLFIGKFCMFHVDFLREIYLTRKAQITKNKKGRTHGSFLLVTSTHNIYENDHSL